MAYGKRRTSRRKTTKARSRSYTRTRRRTDYRVARTRRSAGKRRSYSSGGGSRTVKIVVEQVPAQTLSPIQSALIEQGRVVLPRKARF